MNKVYSYFNMVNYDNEYYIFIFHIQDILKIWEYYLIKHS